jgi:hypothetical protein
MGFWPLKRRLFIVFATLFLAVVGLVSTYLWRGLKSWWSGVTSGLVLMPFVLAFTFSILPSSRLHHRFILGCITIGVCFLSGFLLYLRAEIRRERTVGEDELIVPSSVRSLAGTQLEDSDDPIQSWAQDALGRASLVDSLSIKIMIAKAPVLWLSGAFGSGKTSTLNLLREHLGDKAITISFSTWLPGSAETLTSYLLSDIANGCKKRYVVPGLRQGTRTLRNRYGASVDAANVDLSTSDPWAFDFWGRVTVDGITADPKDRKIQYDFWRRYIGNSRSRLAQALRGFFLPVAVYQENPDSVVENKIPVSDLRKLHDELPQDPNLTDLEQKSLVTMRRFLGGEFKNGISPTDDLY